MPLLYSTLWLVVMVAGIWADADWLVGAAAVCCNVWVVCARLERKLGARP